MTPIRAIVVDDEPAARAAIRTLLADDPEIRLVAECPDGASALAAIAAEPPDLLLLDIQMPEMDGFALLRRLGGGDLPVVVFVTAYDHYALRAFEVHALDYLLKPFDDARFRDAIARAKKQVRQGKAGEMSDQLRRLLAGVGAGGTEAPEPWARRLVTRSEGRMLILNVDDVDWIEADGDHARIHIGPATHQMRETMKHLEQQLDPARFVRIHRSIIANVERIRELRPYFRGEYVAVLHDGTKLKVARGSRVQLARALGQAL